MTDETEARHSDDLSPDEHYELHFTVMAVFEAAGIYCPGCKSKMLQDMAQHCDDEMTDELDLQPDEFLH